MIDKKAIGILIKEARKRLKITQGELSKRSHISRPSIGAYEEGRSNPPVDKLIAIVDALEIESLDQFLKGTWKSDIQKQGENVVTAYKKADHEKRKLVNMILGLKTLL